MLRYGSVPYLNARPLLSGLADEVGPLHFAVPGVLAAELAAGKIDVALAPVVVSFDHPAFHLVPVAAVVARGPVKSVLLFTNGRIEDIRSVGLDTSSRTSAALVRVLFQHRWGTRPTFRSRAPSTTVRCAENDAVLLIGDPALRAEWSGPPPIDLGEAWTQWTGLPFVFAAWIARSAEAAAAGEAPLHRAAESGRARLDAIAAIEAPRLGLDHDAVRAYLRDHLSFHFGEDERRGLERFHDLWRTTPGLGQPGLDGPGPVNPTA